MASNSYKEAVENMIREAAKDFVREKVCAAAAEMNVDLVPDEDYNISLDSITHDLYFGTFGAVFSLLPTKSGKLKKEVRLCVEGKFYNGFTARKVYTRNPMTSDESMNFLLTHEIWKYYREDDLSGIKDTLKRAMVGIRPAPEEALALSKADARLSLIDVWTMADKM